MKNANSGIGIQIGTAIPKLPADLRTLRQPSTRIFKQTSDLNTDLGNAELGEKKSVVYRKEKSRKHNNGYRQCGILAKFEGSFIFAKPPKLCFWRQKENLSKKT